VKARAAWPTRRCAGSVVRGKAAWAPRRREDCEDRGQRASRLGARVTAATRWGHTSGGKSCAKSTPSASARQRVGVAAGLPRGGGKRPGRVRRRCAKCARMRSTTRGSVMKPTIRSRAGQVGQASGSISSTRRSRCPRRRESERHVAARGDMADQAGEGECLRMHGEKQAVSPCAGRVGPCSRVRSAGARPRSSLTRSTTGRNGSARASRSSGRAANCRDRGRHHQFELPRHPRRLFPNWEHDSSLR